MRKKLPDERRGITQKFTIVARDLNAPDDDDGEIHTVSVVGYVSTGCYEDGRLGEVFIKLGKPGSSETLLDMWAIAFSLLLQNGESLETLCGKFANQQFEPRGAVLGVEGIRQCSSPVDLVCKFLMQKYGR